MSELQSRMFTSIGNSTSRYIAFEFPTMASEKEIEMTKKLIALQISSWERWNKEAAQKIVDDWCDEITSVHYNGGYP